MLNYFWILIRLNEKIRFSTESFLPPTPTDQLLGNGTELPTFSNKYPLLSSPLSEPILTFCLPLFCYSLKCWKTVLCFFQKQTSKWVQARLFIKHFILTLSPETNVSSDVWSKDNFLHSLQLITHKTCKQNLTKRSYLQKI